MAKKEKKDKATKKAEKAEKKALRKEENKDPAVKEEKKLLAVRCIAALLCTIIVALSVSSAFGKLAEAVEAAGSVVPVGGYASSGNSTVGGSDNSYDDSTVTPDVPTDDGATDGATDGTVDGTTPDADAPATDDGANAGTPSGAPQSKAQVVAYFNTAVNKVKTGAKTVEQKSVTNYLASATTIPSGIKGVYNMLGGDDWLDKMLKDNSQGAATYTGADIKAKFPVEGEAWASKLSEGDVSSATCTENNGIYTIKITTLGDAKSEGHKHGQGHNPKAFNVILPGVVNDNIPGVAKSMVGTASMAYPASSVTITVDAKTGNVLTAEYDLKWTINFDKMGIILPFGTKSIYSIKW